MQKTLLATNNSLKLLTCFFFPKGGCYDFTEGVNCIENWDWRAVSFLLYPEINHCSIPSATVFRWFLTSSRQLTCTLACWSRCKPVLRQNGPEGPQALWEHRLDHCIEIDIDVSAPRTIKQPTGIIQRHKRDTAGLKMSCFFLFFFLNQRQLEACDVEAFTKVTFYPRKKKQTKKKLYNQ